MFILERLFPSKIQPQRTTKNGLFIYLDNELKRKMQTHNQTVRQYVEDNQFQPNQFLYLLLKNKRTSQIYSRRKLNSYEWLSQCLQSPFQDCKGYIIMGYLSQRSSIARVNSNLPLIENSKCIRSGNLKLYSQSKKVFQQCQLKLHNHHLEYYRVKTKEKKTTQFDLKNSIVEEVSGDKYAFTVKDIKKRFKNIIFRTNSKEDMIGWFLAITQAIKIRSSQIYLNQFDTKFVKSINEKMALYQQKCISLKESSQPILLDEMGRKAMKQYLNKHNSQSNSLDIQILKIIEQYFQMTKLRRQKGEQQSQSLITRIKQSIQEIFQISPQTIKPRQLNNNHQLIKVVQQLMKYLNQKYKKQIIQKKYLNQVFQNNLTQDYTANSKINVKSFFGHRQTKKIE